MKAYRLHLDDEILEEPKSEKEIKKEAKEKKRSEREKRKAEKEQERIERRCRQLYEERMKRIEKRKKLEEILKKEERRAREKKRHQKLEYISQQKVRIEQHRMPETRQWKTVYFKALGLKTRIPPDRTYTDVGLVPDPYQTYKERLQRHGKSANNVRSKNVGGLHFSITDNNGTHHYIAYKQSSDIYTRLTRIHEEVHALCALRPDNLERYLMDVYNVYLEADIAFIKKHRKIYYPDLNADEKEIYGLHEIDTELIPRIVENAYVDKHNIPYENDAPLFQEAKRLYEKFKLD